VILTPRELRVNGLSWPCDLACILAMRSAIGDSASATCKSDRVTPCVYLTAMELRSDHICAN